jgi:hypothetical protein
MNNSVLVIGIIDEGLVGIKNLSPDLSYLNYNFRTLAAIFKTIYDFICQHKMQQLIYW